MEELKTLDEYKGTKRLKSKCGVYYLILKNSVAYVGASTHLNTRLGQHENKMYDYILIDYCHKDNLKRKEGLSINKYQPMYNTNNRSVIFPEIVPQIQQPIKNNKNAMKIYVCSIDGRNKSAVCTIEEAATVLGLIYNTVNKGMKDDSYTTVINGAIYRIERFEVKKPKRNAKGNKENLKNQPK